MKNLRAIISGALSITAYTDPELRRRADVSPESGTVEIRFMNYPLDADHVAMVNDTLLQLVERAVEPPDGKAT